MFAQPGPNATDQLAWLLCQVIDDDAPLKWTQHRGHASCLLRSQELRKILAAFDRFNKTDGE